MSLGGELPIWSTCHKLFLLSLSQPQISAFQILFIYRLSSHRKMKFFKPLETHIHNQIRSEAERWNLQLSTLHRFWEIRRRAFLSHFHIYIIAGMAMPPIFPSIQPRRSAGVVQSPWSSGVFIPVAPRDFRDYVRVLGSKITPPFIWCTKLTKYIDPSRILCCQACTNDEASSAYMKATDAAKKGAAAAQKAGKDVKDKAAAKTSDVTCPYC